MSVTVECDGSLDCKAPEHIHGCFAEGRTPVPSRHSKQQVWRCAKCGRVDAVRWYAGRHRDISVFLDPDSVEEPDWCYGEAEGPFVLAAQDLEEQLEALRKRLNACQDRASCAETEIVRLKEYIDGLERERNEARDALTQLRSVWSHHFDTCEHPKLDALVTELSEAGSIFESVREWMNAPSDTASAPPRDASSPASEPSVIPGFQRPLPDPDGQERQ